ncbi:hypothetical protein Tco_1446685 [Tanacetum coccineum]
MEADWNLAERLQEQEREQFTIEERAKFLHDTIAAQRKFISQQRTEAIRNRPQPRNSIRNQMMTYFSFFKKKHDGNFKLSELKNSSKEKDQSGSKEEVKQVDKEKEHKRKGKILYKEKDELRLCLTIAPDEDKEVDYEILDKKYPIIDWKTQNFGTKPQLDESKRSEEINLNVVTKKPQT